MKKTLTALASLALVIAPVSALAAGIYGTADGTAPKEGSSTAAMHTEAATDAKMTNGKSRADQEITRRIGALTELATRVNAMVHLSAADKGSLTTTINGQITTLNDLKTKIDADTDAATLKTDIQSITKGYRIFALILPQGRIVAAADKIVDVAGTMSALGAKLQTRIGAATGDTTALTASLTDMNAKIADAVSLASAAVSEVGPLVPDNGDATVAAANDKALKDARSKIEEGMKDLAAARKDAASIIKGLKGTEKTSTTAATTESH